MESTIWNDILPVTTFFFQNLCCSIRTSNKELINVPTTQMSIFILFVSAGDLFESAFSLWVSLRYYAILWKWENLSRFSTKLIHVYKKLSIALDCRGNILSKYIIYIFFNFGGSFCGFFPMLFSKAPASWCKKIL